MYVGKLDDVRETHWSAQVNEKTDLFWAHGRFRRRMQTVLAGECGIMVRERSEAGTSSRCSRCGESDHVDRSGDVFRCGTCGFEGHSDVVGSENFLQDMIDDHIDIAGPMARPQTPERTRRRGHTARWPALSETTTGGNTGVTRPKRSLQTRVPARGILPPGYRHSRITDGGIPSLQAWEEVKRSPNGPKEPEQGEELATKRGEGISSNADQTDWEGSESRC